MKTPHIPGHCPDLSSECVALLNDVCCGQRHPVLPDHAGKDAVLVMFLLDDDDHVAHRHIDHIGSILRLRPFDDKPYLMAPAGAKEVALKAVLAGEWNGIAVLLSEHPMLGRARLAFLKQFPQATILCRGCPIREEDIQMVLCGDTWHHEPRYRDRVWREFLMIEQDGGEGYIAYPDDVQAKVARIRHLTAIRPQED